MRTVGGRARGRDRAWTACGCGASSTGSTSTPDGSLIVVDYKTGRAPSERYERGSLAGVQTYALLCESALGRPPAEVRLLHLREPVAISTAATAQTIRGQRRRTVAVWSAIERACDAEDFRPQVGPLCNFCTFKSACPAFAAA